MRSIFDDPARLNHAIHDALVAQVVQVDAIEVMAGEERGAGLGVWILGHANRVTGDEDRLLVFHHGLAIALAAKVIDSGTKAWGERFVRPLDRELQETGTDRSGGSDLWVPGR